MPIVADQVELESEIICPICGATVMDHSDLRMHEESVHSITSIPSES